MEIKDVIKTPVFMRNNKGMALVNVLFIAAILAIFAYAISDLSVRNAIFSSRTRDHEQATQAALYGLNQARVILLNDIINDGDWRNNDWNTDLNLGVNQPLSGTDGCLSIESLSPNPPTNPVQVGLRVTGMAGDCNTPRNLVTLDANLHAEYPQALRATLYGQRRIIRQGNPSASDGWNNGCGVICQICDPDPFNGTCDEQRLNWEIPSLRLQELIDVAMGGDGSDDPNDDYYATPTSFSGTWNPASFTGQKGALNGTVVLDMRQSDYKTTSSTALQLGPPTSQTDTDPPPPGDNYNGNCPPSAGNIPLPGILVVLGNLEFQGDVDYYGVIYVTGKISGGNSVRVCGSVIANEIETSGGAGWNIIYNQAAISNFATTATQPQLSIDSVWRTDN